MTDVKKATALTAATSLESSDSLLAFDSTGKAKKVTADMVKNYGDVIVTGNPQLGWLRIAKNSANYASTAIIAIVTKAVQQGAFLLSIANGAAATMNAGDVNILGKGSASNGMAVSNVIPKLRILRPSSSGNSWFLEIYISAVREITVKKTADVNVSLLNFEPSNETPPTNYTAIEIGLGGVNT